jgi:hypothetical protein
MTVLPVSIKPRRTAIVSAVLSGTGTKNVFSGLAPHISEYTMPLHYVCPVVLVMTELALVNFDGLVRTADFLRAAQHIVPI